MVEKLEGRVLLAASLKAGVLTVAGTAKPDEIVVLSADAGSRPVEGVSGGAYIEASVNGVKAWFAAGDVARVIVKGGGGKDNIKLAESVGDGGNLTWVNALAVDAQILGGAGNDTITGGAGNDGAFGGPGNDWMTASSGTDLLSGGGGNDFLRRNTDEPAAMMLSGDGGNDTLASAWDADTLVGGLGKDRFYGGTVKDLKKGETAEAYDLVPPEQSGGNGPGPVVGVHPPGAPPEGSGLRGTYFALPGFAGPSVVRVDWGVDFNWGAGKPIEGIDANGFSVRWEGQIEPAYTETYTISAIADDLVRVWVDNLLVIDHWDGAKANETSGLIALDGGQTYDIKVEYEEQGGDAWAQLRWKSASQADETVPTARLASTVRPAREERVVYVNNSSPTASDENSGLQPGQAVRTLDRAADIASANNRLNIATRVIIAPGLYRESINMTGGSERTEAPIRFEAQQKGTVIIDGADIWTGWAPSIAGEAGVYTHTWTGNWGVKETPDGWPETPEILRRREILFVNGKLLKQVISSDQLETDSFFVDDVAGIVTMKVAAGLNVDAARVEWGMRSQIVRFQRMTNVSISGLVVQHDASGLEDGEAVSFRGSRNILVEDCTIQWNSQDGLINSNTENLIQRRCVMSNNGGSGGGGSQVRALTMESVVTNNNNWRGALGEFYGWAFAGIKQLYLHDAIYRNLEAAGNQATGLWLDTDVVNVLVDNALIHDNIEDGIFLEALQGPITIQNSVIAHNNEYGLRNANAGAVTLSGNIFYDNWLSDTKEGAQINISGDGGGRDIENFETGEQMTTQAVNWRLINNQIVGTNVRQLGIRTDLGGTPWEAFVSSLVSERNLWWNGVKAEFIQRSGGVEMTLAEWKAYSVQDEGSVFENPRYRDPAGLDFTRV